MANEPLIAGKQYGVGGVTSVRGYDEREVTGDTGYAASMEVWSPPIAFDIRALAFGDIGYRKNQNPLPGESEYSNLGSFGLGLRWSY
ncbi:MAG TPA: ShlB/FhaC/HecB family hemolysin secretion/activation protein [Gammaproteobacteria bacterium]